MILHSHGVVVPNALLWYCSSVSRAGWPPMFHVIAFWAIWAEFETFSWDVQSQTKVVRFVCFLLNGVSSPHLQSQNVDLRACGHSIGIKSRKEFPTAVKS